MSKKSIFRASNLSLSYHTRLGDSIHAVEDASIDLEEGDVLGIAGESGSGKSTLAKGCLGLFTSPLYLTSGNIELNGRSIMGLKQSQLRREVHGQKISMIPQGALNALNPTCKVKKFAADMWQSHHPEMKKIDIYNALKQRFQAVGLDADRVLNTYPCELSGGMKQRVVIAVSTLLNPDLVIADEPTSALDVSTQKSVISMLFDLMEKKIIKSMIFVTHELPLLKHVSNKIAIMYAGELIEQGDTQEVLKDPIHPYTKALMGAMLEVGSDPNRTKPIGLKGAPPKLADPPKGCRFAPRCPVARDDCASKRQAMQPIRGRHVRCSYAE